MVNQKRSLPMPPEQPERKRGRPSGKNRVALSEKERRERNACYERERRGIEASLMSELAEAAGLDPTLPKMAILDEAAKYMVRGWEAKKTWDIADLKRINAKLISHIQDAKKRLRTEFAEDAAAQELLASDSDSGDGSSSSSDSEMEGSSSEEETEGSSSEEEMEGSSSEEETLSCQDLEESDDATLDLDIKQEDIGAMRTRPYSGRKTASRMPAADVCLAEDIKIWVETAGETSSEPYIPPELFLTDTGIPDDLGHNMMKVETEEMAKCESYIPPEPLLSDTAIPDLEDRTMTEEVASSQSYIPPEPLLSDTAIPDDLDSIFETSTVSLFSFSSIFSEDGSLSTRLYTGRYTPAQG